MRNGETIVSEDRKTSVSGDTRADALQTWGRYRLQPLNASVKFLLSLFFAFATAWWAQSQAGLAPAPARMLFIMVLAALLWLLEAIPAYSVGILVIALQILLLGNSDRGIFAQEPDDWQTFVVVLGNPLIWLFFGGFVLSAAVTKTGLDLSLAAHLIQWFGKSPSLLLFGVMGGSMVFSMFMSNTATTTMMLAIIAPMVVGLGSSNPFSKALLLGVPFAANLGGMATIIGSPPNAIAAGALATVPGQEINFLTWMLFGLPPAVMLFSITWVFLRTRYPDNSIRFVAAEFQAATVDEPERTQPPWQRRLVIFTLLLTVGLWMSGQWTDIPTAVVSFLPITVLTASGILKEQDVRQIPWDILLLLAGGLALGNGVRDTGLADWLVAALPLEGLGQYGVVFMLCYATVILSNLMSNTAAANILVPIAVVLASGFEDLAVVPLALCASCAMCLPISTPPNAIAYGTGQLQSSDFLIGGLLVGLIAPVVIVGWSVLILGWL
ncbi:MAG: transporter [Gammaproteobacteria bacterium]|nr:MAG: transporter [Gammaproteobacteria bacterium]